jgi:hypothetical protein
MPRQPLHHRDIRAGVKQAADEDRSHVVQRERRDARSLHLPRRLLRGDGLKNTLTLTTSRW